jgi:hypothetical protein
MESSDRTWRALLPYLSCVIFLLICSLFLTTFQAKPDVMIRLRLPFNVFWCILFKEYRDSNFSACPGLVRVTATTYCETLRGSLQARVLSACSDKISAFHLGSDSCSSSTSEVYSLLRHITIII